MDNDLQAATQWHPRRTPKCMYQGIVSGQFTMEAVFCTLTSLNTGASGDEDRRRTEKLPLISRIRPVWTKASRPLTSLAWDARHPSVSAAAKNLKAFGKAHHIDDLRDEPPPDGYLYAQKETGRDEKVSWRSENSE